MGVFNEDTKIKIFKGFQGKEGLFGGHQALLLR